MSSPDPIPPELARLAPIPRDDDDPVFPAPWAARGFALTVAVNERTVFSWSEWAEALGAALAAEKTGSDSEAYWRAWLAALETVLARHDLVGSAELLRMQQAWRSAAKGTPHGEAIELRRL